jgi:hypothetical protein
MENNTKPVATKKTKKHGAIALTVLGITLIFIILGIYLFGQSSTSPTTAPPIKNNVRDNNNSQI